jgi:hypothetical protein
VVRGQPGVLGGHHGLVGRGRDSGLRVAARCHSVVKPADERTAAALCAPGVRVVGAQVGLDVGLRIAVGPLHPPWAERGAVTARIRAYEDRPVDAGGLSAQDLLGHEASHRPAQHVGSFHTQVGHELSRGRGHCGERPSSRCRGLAQTRVVEHDHPPVGSQCRQEGGVPFRHRRARAIEQDQRLSGPRLRPGDAVRTQAGLDADFLRWRDTGRRSAGREQQDCRHRHAHPPTVPQVGCCALK